MLVYLPIFFVLLTALPMVAAKDCPSGWFGSKCDFQCHCSKSKNCSVDGSCPQYETCKRGYFGPACQYVDMVVEAVSPSTESYLRDSNDSTCNPHEDGRSLQMSFLRPFPLKWFRIVVNESKHLMNLTVDLNQWQACKNHRQFVVTSTVMDITCDGDVPLTNLTIIGEIVPYVCSIYISGGRNKALKQSVQQTSDWQIDLSKCQASNAVDGNRDPDYNHYSCSHTNTELHGASWSLTFTNPEVIYRIVIYGRNRDTHRLNRLQLQTFDEDGAMITAYTNNIVNSSLLVIPVPSSVPVKTMGLKQSNHFVDVLDLSLTLCEVEMYGENNCPLNTYGLLCQDICKCKEYEVCSEVTGKCAVGCPPGFHGLNCNLLCAPNCRNNLCAVISGVCLGCSNGYYATRCDQKCIPGTFGRDCMTNCSDYCTHVCDFVTGACTCRQPYGEYLCKGCAAGRYGRNCSSLCPRYCKSPTCTRGSGDCAECFTTHKGRHCQECNDGYYGADCSSTCPKHCHDGKCNNATGDCFSCKDNRRGRFCKDCADRYEGANCTECSGHYAGLTCTDCKVGYHGDNCSEKCPKYCENKQCHQDTGHCYSCIGERHGLLCEECSQNSYGPMCELKCTGSCLNGTCDQVSGLCVYCAEGYDGEYCLGAEPTYYLYLAPLLPLYVLSICCILVCLENIKEDQQIEQACNIEENHLHSIKTTE